MRLLFLIELPRSPATCRERATNRSSLITSLLRVSIIRCEFGARGSFAEENAEEIFCRHKQNVFAPCFLRVQNQNLAILFLMAILRSDGWSFFFRPSVQGQSCRGGRENKTKQYNRAIRTKKRKEKNQPSVFSTLP